MLDLGGLVLLLGSLVGAIKGLGLPLWLPQGAAITALALLMYQGLFKRSRFALIHAILEREQKMLEKAAKTLICPAFSPTKCKENSVPNGKTSRSGFERKSRTSFRMRI
ncbi:MAG: hypothetical protein P4L69_20425 [Desulfosporosinus sp.]|nr:hypothetical protein [Desulfosporosinus sp.]